MEAGVRFFVGLISGVVLGGAVMYTFGKKEGARCARHKIERSRFEECFIVNPDGSYRIREEFLKNPEGAKKVLPSDFMDAVAEYRQYANDNALGLEDAQCLKYLTIKLQAVFKKYKLETA